MHHTPVLHRLCLGALIWMVFHLTTGLEAGSVLRSSSAVRAGMSQERLARIDQMLDDAVQSNEIPGAVALIARRGKVVLHKAYAWQTQRPEFRCKATASFGSPPKPKPSLQLLS